MNASTPAMPPGAAAGLPRLALTGIRKQYPAVLANDDVSPHA
jgi:hypothetical protein